MNGRCLFAALALATALGGCDADPGLRLTIESEGVVAGVMIDELTVDVVASQVEPRRESGELVAFTCRASSETWAGDELILPIELTVRPGDVDWECVGVRAQGYLEGELVIRAEEIYCADLADGVTRERLTLDGDCRITDGREACAADLVCRGGLCETSLMGELLELSPVSLEACDRGSE